MCISFISISYQEFRIGNSAFSEGGSSRQRTLKLEYIENTASSSHTVELEYCLRTAIKMIKNLEERKKNLDRWLKVLRMFNQDKRKLAGRYGICLKYLKVCHIESRANCSVLFQKTGQKSMGLNDRKADIV